MTPPRRHSNLLLIGLPWVLISVPVMVLMWLVTGKAEAAILGALGPLSVLVFKPGENLPGKIVVALLGAMPVVLGALWLGQKWSGLRTWARVLWVAGLSAIWHGLSVAFLLIVLAGAN